MQVRSWSEAWRVLSYTLAISVALLALQQLELAIFGGLTESHTLREAGLFDRYSTADLEREAQHVAQASAPALARLPPQTRQAALNLGYHLGLATELAGSMSFSGPAARASAQAIVDTHLTRARGLAQALGLGAVDLLPVANLKEFADLNRRLEQDENGLNARIGNTLSPLHAQLYLLGAYLGMEHARIESTGQISMASALQIRRHASVAGIPANLWEPLGASTEGVPPDRARERYRAALLALDQSLAVPAR